MFTEKEFQAQVIMAAKLCGWRVAHFRPARVMRGGKEIYETPVAADGKGFPDLILVKPGRLIAAELKVGKNKPTAEQSAWLHDLNAAGVEIHVWYPTDWDEIERVLGYVVDGKLKTRV